VPAETPWINWSRRSARQECTVENEVRWVGGRQKRRSVVKSTFVVADAEKCRLRAIDAITGKCRSRRPSGQSESPPETSATHPREPPANSFQPSSAGLAQFSCAGGRGVLAGGRADTARQLSGPPNQKSSDRYAWLAVAPTPPSRCQGAMPSSSAKRRSRRSADSGPSRRYLRIENVECSDAPPIFG